MGVLYDVLFKPIGRGDGSTTALAAAADSNPTTTNDLVPPEWVLDRRDGGSLVWRRYTGATPSRRRRVEFLDAVDIRVFERDDYGEDGSSTPPPSRDSDNDDDSQLFWTDDWSSWEDEAGGGGGGDSKTLFCRQSHRDDYPVLVAVSVTFLGLCISLAYQFAPVKWLFHQLLVD